LSRPWPHPFCTVGISPGDAVSNRFLVTIPTTVPSLALGQLATAVTSAPVTSCSSQASPRGFTTPSPDFPNPNDARPRKRVHLDPEARSYSRAKDEGLAPSSTVRDLLPPSTRPSSNRGSKILPVYNELDSVEEELNYLNDYTSPGGSKSATALSSAKALPPQEHTMEDHAKSANLDSMDTSDILVPSLTSSVDMDDEDMNKQIDEEFSSSRGEKPTSYEKRKRWKRSCSELFESSEPSGPTAPTPIGGFPTSFPSQPIDTIATPRHHTHAGRVRVCTKRPLFLFKLAEVLCLATEKERYCECRHTGLCQQLSSFGPKPDRFWNISAFDVGAPTNLRRSRPCWIPSWWFYWFRTQVKERWYVSPLPSAMSIWLTFP